MWSSYGLVLHWPRRPFLRCTPLTREFCNCFTEEEFHTDAYGRGILRAALANWRSPLAVGLVGNVNYKGGLAKISIICIGQLGIHLHVCRVNTLVALQDMIARHGPPTMHIARHIHHIPSFAGPH